MVHHLRGRPAPPLPAIPGRIVSVLGDDLPLAPDERDDLLLSDATDSECGAALGVSRQRANQLRQALRERMASEEATP